MATKLISLRVNEELLKKIDKYADGHCYLSRSLIINNILEGILNDSSQHNLWVLTHTDKKILL